MVVNGDLVAIYTTYVTGAVAAWLGVILTISSVFIAFSIANQLRWIILRMVGKN